MVDLRPQILIITLIVNILIIPFRGRDSQTGWGKKAKNKTNYMLSTRDDL